MSSGYSVSTLYISPMCSLMLCGVWLLLGIVKWVGRMGNGFTNSVKSLSMCTSICCSGRFSAQRKQRRFLRVAWSILAPVDTIRAGLNCSLIVFSPTERSRVFTFCKSRKCCRASSQVSSWRLKKRCSELSSLLSLPLCMFWRASTSIVRRRSLYRLLELVFSMLNEASLFPPQRRQQ